MLHSQSRESGAEGGNPLTTHALPLVLTLVLVLLGACREERPQLNKEAFSELKTPAFVISPARLHGELLSLWNAPDDTIASDAEARRYYCAGRPYLWITRWGISTAADSLLTELHTLTAIGFSERAFGLEQIEADLAKLRALRPDADGISRLLARLEYRLTRAYLRYAAGERFGYVNPRYVLNRLRTLPEDSLARKPRYRCLCGLNVQRPDSAFYAIARRMIRPDSIRIFLRQCHQMTTLYRRLLAHLPQCRNRAERDLTLCNIERARWRPIEAADTNKRYIVVNLAAQMLYGYQRDSIITMRVCCGSTEHPSPLLTSHIKWIEVNPVWNIPYSIISREVALHAGDADYFQRNNYTIYNKETGEPAEPENISAASLRSGAWRIVQAHGEGNSLGRYIFRFPNDFSVFLHDTSNGKAFQRTVRLISHGCVRVERPRDLARFALGYPGGRTEELLDDEERTRYLNLKDFVHVELAYYTLYPQPDGTIKQWPDGYGYDRPILDNLKPFRR